MSDESKHVKSVGPILSICIPTYNRENYLRGCLDSLERAARGHWDDIEVIISDNASPDNTQDVVKEYQQRFPIRYYRNSTNIGGERNFYAVVNRSVAEYVWIFGDDDEFGEDSVGEFLAHIRLGYDLILANYSSWSKNMDVMLSSRRLPWEQPMSLDDPSAILAKFGINLGYISSMVLKKKILQAVPPSEYEKYIKYGFPHAYSIYCGLLSQSRVAYIPTSLFKRREENCVGFFGDQGLVSWITVFIEGPPIIFDTLGKKGYSPASVHRAKLEMLRNCGPGMIIPNIAAVDRPALRRIMYRQYRSSWRFWFAWLPVLLLPKAILRTLYSTYLGIRGYIKSMFSRIDANAGK